MSFTCYYCRNKYSNEELSESALQGIGTKSKDIALEVIPLYKQVCIYCDAWDEQGETWGPEDEQEILTPTQLLQHGYDQAFIDRDKLNY